MKASRWIDPDHQVILTTFTCHEGMGHGGMQSDFVGTHFELAELMDDWHGAQIIEITNDAVTVYFEDGSSQRFVPLPNCFTPIATMGREHA